MTIQGFKNEKSMIEGLREQANKQEEALYKEFEIFVEAIRKSKNTPKHRSISDLEVKLLLNESAFLITYSEFIGDEDCSFHFHCPISILEVGGEEAAKQHLQAEFERELAKKTHSANQKEKEDRELYLRLKAKFEDSKY